MKREPEGEMGTCRGAWLEQIAVIFEETAKNEYKVCNECTTCRSFRQYAIPVTVSLRNMGLNNEAIPESVKIF